jgi:hypothetical protein
VGCDYRLGLDWVGVTAMLGIVVTVALTGCYCLL